METVGMIPVRCYTCGRPLFRWLLLRGVRKYCCLQRLVMPSIVTDEMLKFPTHKVKTTKRIRQKPNKEAKERKKEEEEEEEEEEEQNEEEFNNKRVVFFG